MSMTNDTNENIIPVLDRGREWFQTQPQKYDFNGDYEDWYYVETYCIDRTKKHPKIKSPFSGGVICEFVKYSKENFLSYYYPNGGVEEIKKGIFSFWNRRPFLDYDPPYHVMVGGCSSLEEVKNTKWVKSLLNNPIKIINHSTFNTLGLVSKEVSEWRMKKLWEGSEPLFYKDKETEEVV